ncbi:MAG: zf-HC2 domain-containing protein [Planctomycetes bacterium]|nr:zf-HC2 domain-containing protein [Planctomycetota bacterium]
MTCDQCRRWWSPYLDSELDASKTFEVSEHLRVCECCRSRFEGEKDLDQWMRDTLRSGGGADGAGGDVTMPSPLWTKLQADIKQEAISNQETTGSNQETIGGRPGRLRIVGWFRPLMMAASIAIVTVVGVFVWDRPQVSDVASPNVGELLQVIPASQSMAGLLQQATPDMTMFKASTFKASADDDVEDASADFRAQLDLISLRVLGTRIQFELSKESHHKVDLVGVYERSDVAGNAYVEVRLNCCGNPTVLALRSASSQSTIAELSTVTKTSKFAYGPHSGEEASNRAGTGGSIEVRSRLIDNVMVGGAAANHTLDAVFSAIGVVKA